MNRRDQRGLTLIELMVALAIGSVMSLVVLALMASSEGQRRTVRSGSELDQAGSIAMFQLDQWVRSAGSGLAQAGSYAYGCELFAAKSGTQLLPMSSALPAPFASVNPGTSGVFRLAPALILPGQTSPGASNAVTPHTSDVLVLMSSGSNGGQVPTQFSSGAGAAQLNLANTLALSASDLVLLTDQQPAPAGGVAPCMMTQVDSSFVAPTATANLLTAGLAGTWYASTVGDTSVTGYSATGAALDLGKPSSGTAPSFQVIGVGDNNVLYSYDLLDLTGTQLEARADSVFELHALYGVDTDGDGKVDAWVPPDSGSYTTSALMAGTSSSANLIKTIRALRIGLILRTALPERNPVNAAASVSMFSDLGSGLTFTRSFSGSELNYRYRTVEATIPLRNNTF